MNSQVRSALLFCISCLTGIPSTQAQFNAKSSDAPEIARREAGSTIDTMLLGVYHFNNPGADELNLEVDDYFTDQRQAEIAEVVERLAKFQPTKIFVESFAIESGSYR